MHDVILTELEDAMLELDSKLCDLQVKEEVMPLVPTECCVFVASTYPKFRANKHLDHCPLYKEDV